MNSDQINCFLIVAKHMSFSKAASELLIAQPAVSRHIINLERELGVVLFNRDSKNIIFTAAGESFYNYFIRSAKEFSELQEKYATPSSTEKQQLLYFTSPVWIVPAALAQNQKHFQSRHPNIDISLEYNGGKDLDAALNSGKIDVLFHICKYLSEQPKMSYVKIAEIPNVILYSVDHPLARFEEPPLGEFSNLKFLYLSEEKYSSSFVQKITNYMTAHYGIQVDVEGVDNFETLISMVENCQGLLLMDIWCRSIDNPRLKYIVLDTKEEIGMAWKTGEESDALKTFIEETILFFKQHPTWNS